MTAQPLQQPETLSSEPDLHPNPSEAECIHAAAELLVTSLQSGTTLTADIMRSAMEDAFGASDTEGAWVWKDTYEAAEVAQIMMLNRYGASMWRQAKSPKHFLSMIAKLADLVPTQTRRSEAMVALQQFSTPLPLAAIVAAAANIKSNDLVLEPSAGTGILASFAQASGARLALNELSDLRRELLTLLFPDATVSVHDAASIDDRLDRSIAPSVILMNPPFSVAAHVDGKYKAATAKHVLSALARLAPGGRLVAITGSNFNPGTKKFSSAFERIFEEAELHVSVPLSSRFFSRHGTNVETRLTVLDKYPDDYSGDKDIKANAFLPISHERENLLTAVLERCPPRHPMSSHSSSEPMAKPNISSIRDAARAEIKAIEVERAKHPFDTAETIELNYEVLDQSDPSAGLSEGVYEPYVLQSIEIMSSAEHPTALVQSAAMASVAPPAPKHRPKLLKSLIDDGILSGPQLESVIYAGDAHATHLEGWFKPSEIEGAWTYP